VAKLSEAGLLPGGNIIGATKAVCKRVSCAFHRNESRYEVDIFESENLVLIYCIACSPKNELVRFKIARE
jgi:hypothetical protein